MSEEYYNALEKCGIRYFYMNQALDEDDEKTLLFTIKFLREIQNRLPLLKLNRWLGYIQGCLIERGYTTVEAERDFTRPLFKPLDFPVNENLVQAVKLSIENDIENRAKELHALMHVNSYLAKYTIPWEELTPEGKDSWRVQARKDYKQSI